MSSNSAPLDWEPEDEDDYEVARSYLKEEFAAWCAAKGTVFEADAGESPIHYKFHYVDGHLTRWSTEDLDEVYLELHPGNLLRVKSTTCRFVNQRRTIALYDSP